MRKGGKERRQAAKVSYEKDGEIIMVDAEEGRKEEREQPPQKQVPLPEEGAGISTSRGSSDSEEIYDCLN
jgi:hypothetical protein